MGPVVADLLEHQIVLRCVGDEYRIVLEHEVEGGRVRLVLHQLRSGNIEDLHGTSQHSSERGVRPQMGGGAGEPDHRAVAAWLGVNPLRVRRRHVAQDLDLRFDHAERLRVHAADGSPTTLDHRRFADQLFPVVDDLFQEPIEIRVDRLYLRRIADEIQWHQSALLFVDVGTSHNAVPPSRCSQPSSPSHFKADKPGRKKYSPPRSTLNVSMPWTRRLTGSLGMVKVASSSCSPMIGSRSRPNPTKLPSLIHSCWRNSIVAMALALMNRKMAPRGTSSSSSDSAFGSYGRPYVVPRLMRRCRLTSVSRVSFVSRGFMRRMWHPNGTCRPRGSFA